jgi:hypothetical protein
MSASLILPVPRSGVLPEVEASILQRKGTDHVRRNHIQFRLDSGDQVRCHRIAAFFERPGRFCTSDHGHDVGLNADNLSNMHGVSVGATMGEAGGCVWMKSAKGTPLVAESRNETSGPRGI